MPTYRRAVAADLSKLTDAAAKWDAMAGRFTAMAKTYRDKVLGVSTDGSWTGVSARASVTPSLSTARDIDAAATEAEAVASVLRQAHSRLGALQDALRRTVRDARAAGMLVDDEGTVTSGPGTPDHEAAAHWAGRVGSALNALCDGDYGVRVALEDAARYQVLRTDSDFNAGADGDLARDDARAAATLALQLDSAGSLAADDLDRLRMLTRSGEHDTGFTRTLFTSLGADNTMRLASTLRHLATTGRTGDRGPYAALESEVAAGLATATKDPDSAFYTRWTRQVRQAGLRAYGEKVNPVYGYQSLVTLMAHGGAGYGTRYLCDLGDDVIAAEKSHAGIWDRFGPPVPGVAGDPLDGLLGVMGREPAAAQAFLDPSDPHRRLDYLLGQRTWPTEVLTAGGALIPLRGPAACPGFGAALEAATTGRPYGGSLLAPAIPHSRTGAAIMTAVVEHLGGTPQLIQNGDTPGRFAGLRSALGDMAADYMADFQRAASRFPDLPSFGARLGLKNDTAAVGLLTAIGTDPHAYAAITGANQALTSNLVGEAFTTHSVLSMPEQVQNATHPGSVVAGLMSSARAQAVHDKYAASDTEFNENAGIAGKWATRLVAVGADKALEDVVDKVPIVGTVSEWVQDDLNESVMKTMTRDNTLVARHEALDQYTNARDAAIDSAQAAVARAGRLHHLSTTSIRQLQDSVATQVADSFGTGTIWENVHHG